MGLIKIGRVIRPHGVKGGMKVSSSFKYKKEAFKKDNTLIINNRTYKLLSYTFAGGNQLDIAYLSGINTIDDVIAIRQQSIYINKHDLHISKLFVKVNPCNRYELKLFISIINDLCKNDAMAPITVIPSSYISCLC
jgi:hypothetical protein